MVAYMNKTIKEEVIEIVCQYSKCSVENENLRLINDLGIDSFSILQLAVDLEEAFDIKIDDEELVKSENFGRVNSIIEFINSKVGEQVDNY